MANKRKAIAENQMDEGSSGAAEKNVVSLSQAAYDKILQWLFDRKLPAGALMSQSELSKLTAMVSVADF